MATTQEIKEIAGEVWERKLAAELQAAHAARTRWGEDDKDSKSYAMHAVFHQRIAAFFREKVRLKAFWMRRGDEGDVAHATHRCDPF